MIYNDFKGLKLSALGFGTMRLPLLEDGKSIDRTLTRKMMEYALEHGVNYIDTAVPYHNGYSEAIVGEILSAFPRESYFLADKYPGHQHASAYNPAATFEEQLRKCRTDHFDFYLMHNMCENSLPVYNDPQWGILDYFKEQKRLGRIRHLGFSSHADVDTLKSILDSPYGPEMEFCQIQLNYLDWDLQKARQKCALLGSYGIPVWVMEPVRGGLLARLPEEQTALLRSFRPSCSTASWAFRWLQDIPGVTVVLSGMSAMDQVEDNIATFECGAPLSAEERQALMSIASSLIKPLPCTACRYCCDGCPAGLDIPTLLAAYNDLKLQPSLTPLMRIEAMEESMQPSACLQCGACSEICPQGIDVPSTLEELSGRLAKMTSWREICRQREKEAYHE